MCMSRLVVLLLVFPLFVAPAGGRQVALCRCDRSSSEQLPPITAADPLDGFTNALKAADFLAWSDT